MSDILQKQANELLWECERDCRRLAEENTELRKQLTVSQFWDAKTELAAFIAENERLRVREAELLLRLAMKGTGEDPACDHCKRPMALIWACMEDHPLVWRRHE